VSPISRRKSLLLLGGISSLAGCIGNGENEPEPDPESEPETDPEHEASDDMEEVPEEIEAVLDQKWQAQKENDPETYQSLYHSDSPIRDEDWWNDDDYWGDTFEEFSNDFEYTIEARELLAKTEVEATVQEVVTRSHRRMPEPSTLQITYEIEVEDNEWHILDEVSEEYFEWMDNGDEYIPEDFDSCDRLVIYLSSLPEYAREEVETALDEGVYEAEDLYLRHLIDVDESYLREVEDVDTSERQRQSTFYQAQITETDNGYRLEVDEATPAHSANGIDLENGTDTEQTVTVHVERESPDPDVDEIETVFEETYTVPPDEEIETEEFDRYFVEHYAEIETDDASETFEWTERELAFQMRMVFFTEEGIEQGPIAEVDPIDCRGVWEDAIEGD